MSLLDSLLEKGIVSVTKCTSTVKGNPYTKAPKSKSPNQAVSLPESTLQLAKQYRKEQIKYQLSIGSQWKGNNYIFIQWNGRQIYLSAPYSTFKDIIHRYNARMEDHSQFLPNIPLHGLRHTSAILLISQNIDVRSVSGRLGHAQTSTTVNIYNHALQKMDEKEANTLEDLFHPKADDVLVKC